MNVDIDKIAQLARIHLTPEEKPGLEKDLEAILGYIGKLDRLDTEKITPTSHVLNLENVCRKDTPGLSDAAEKAIEHAPCAEGRFFKVPKIVQRD
ncbi:MAG TPA: Asp-tRNA(Asn)/Glu-tRNA(Gln) amidotransferase subunit GatC [Candidatus Omnitrophota bacterium]|nr:Asp-tRNA(Asn)/Glu-tRNA(Gln) amidotransferase subunit GatC [Candidatus Omnitrophota bacterium]